MNLDVLECFLHLSDSLNFTETAKVLGLTQPSVSRKIKSLEDQIETQLFVRDQHRVKLTPRGKQLRSELAPLLTEIQSTLQSAKDDADKIEGSLSFACYPEVGQYFFTRLLVEFQNKYPSVDLQVTYLLDNEMQKGLRDGSLDFAVMGDPFISEAMRSYPLLQERAVLVTRAQNKYSPDDPGAPNVFVAYNSSDQLLFSYLKKFAKSTDLNKEKRLFTVNSHKSIIDILKSQDSYAVLPLFSVDELIKNNTLRIVNDHEITNQLFLVHRETSYLPKKDATFKKFLSDRCKQSDLTAKTTRTYQS